MFDPNDLDGVPASGCIPAGWYDLQIKKVETKFRDEKLYTYDVTAEIVGGDHDTRRVFPKFYWDLKNGGANDFHRGRFRDMLRACGYASHAKHPELRETHKDLSELVNGFDAIEGMVVRGKVVIEVDKGGKYPDKNNVKEWEPKRNGVIDFRTVQSGDMPYSQSMEEAKMEPGEPAPWDRK